VDRPILHHRTKFRKDRSNRCGGIAIFVIFQDGGIQKFEILTVGARKGVNVSQSTKFHQNRLNSVSCREMVI